jgi:hypothetical protein
VVANVVLAGGLVLAGLLIVWSTLHGVELKEAALANIRFDKAYQKAIEDKQIEEQRVEQKLYELTQAQRQEESVAATASCTNWR